MNHFVLIHTKLKSFKKKNPENRFPDISSDFNSPTVTGIYTTNRKYNFYTNASIILYTCLSAYPRKAQVYSIVEKRFTTSSKFPK